MESIIKDVIKIKGLDHPLIGKCIIAMILSGEGLEIMTEDGQVFIATGATNIIRYKG